MNRKLENRSDIAPLKTADGTLLTDDTDKADLLNSYFKSVFTKDNGSLSPFPSRLTNEDFISDISTSPEIIFRILKKLKTNSAAGPDGLPPIFYHHTAPSLSFPLSIIFRTLIDTHSIPDEWRTAIITPKFKKGSPSDQANYRPISLTCTSCKILESIITSEILQFSLDHHLITKHQHGFISRHSTSSNLLECINDWTISISNKKSVTIAYIDYKSEFDCISHPKLLHKLSAYGIKGNLYLWIQSFLTNRTQTVRLNSCYSKSCPVTSGVVQGSVIGPILFNIYINDVIDQTDHNITIKLFADDLRIYTDLPNISISNFQKQLDILHHWSSTWQMLISHSKCNILHIGPTNSPNTPQTFHINNNHIRQVDYVVDLGVTIDTNLRFKIHINTITQKASQRSALIKRCFLLRNANNLTQAFKTYVRPILEYGSTTWSPSYGTQIMQIESVQRHFTKFITGCHHLSYPDRLKFLHLQSLEHRRLLADLIMCYNIIRNHSCIDPSDFFTQPHYKYSRGHPFHLSIPLAKLNSRKHFFSNRIINIWNSLPTEIVLSHSTSAFKYHIKRLDLSKFLVFPTYTLI